MPLHDIAIYLMLSVVRYIHSKGADFESHVLCPESEFIMIGGAKHREREANILLIVYEHLVRDIMARMFTERGHTVVTCAVGLDGIRTFEKGKRQFDLVMSNSSLPGISGFDVAKRIKELSRKTPVILIDGWEKELDMEGFQECGADLIICKPLWLDKVLNLVENAVVAIDR